MKHKYMHKCLIVVLICAFIDSTFAQNQNRNQRETEMNDQRQSEVEKQQYELQQKFKKQQQQNLEEWIVQQIKHNQQFHDVLPYESATFMLKPNTPQIYRIPVSLAQEMMVKVSLFSISKEGFPVLPQNPELENFVQITTLDRTHRSQYFEGKVYIQRIIKLRFQDTHKYIKFTNKASHPIIAILDIEQQELLMEILVSDDQFALTNKKIQTILRQTKETQINRQHLYKWQWGFYQKLWRHQSDMLGFTGAQLLVIVVTSIVQMYCIKNLIDNELVI